MSADSLISRRLWLNLSIRGCASTNRRKRINFYIAIRILLTVDSWLCKYKTQETELMDQFFDAILLNLWILGCARTNRSTAGRKQIHFWMQFPKSVNLWLCKYIGILGCKKGTSLFVANWSIFWYASAWRQMSYISKYKFASISLFFTDNKVHFWGREFCGLKYIFLRDKRRISLRFWFLLSMVCRCKICWQRGSGILSFWWYHSSSTKIYWNQRCCNQRRCDQRWWYTNRRTLGINQHP